MKYYTLDILEHLYRQENPDLSEDEIKIRARNLHRQLNTMDVSWKRSNRLFYRKVELYEGNKPFG